MRACSDFGFDPLGLATVPENFERFKESEVYHCRWAMLAVVWFLILISAWHGLRRHGRTELN
jgi:hypothetical protein